METKPFTTVTRKIFQRESMRGTWFDGVGIKAAFGHKSRYERPIVIAVVIATMADEETFEAHIALGGRSALFREGAFFCFIDSEGSEIWRILQHPEDVLAIVQSIDVIWREGDDDSAYR
jgi:hypothetical protein